VCSGCGVAPARRPHRLIVGDITDNSRDNQIVILTTASRNQSAHFSDHRVAVMTPKCRRHTAVTQSDFSSDMTVADMLCAGHRFDFQSEPLSHYLG